MRITLKKDLDRGSTLSCLRSDGSFTWTRVHPGLELHDIAHYVVETELNFQKAFFGSIARGIDITDYDAPRNRRPADVLPANLSMEALQTEHIVNLLMTGMQRPGLSGSMFLSTLAEVLNGHKLTFPEKFTVDTLKKIESRIQMYWLRWQNLADGQELQFTFDEE